jgi:hypothetical protein
MTITLGFRRQSLEARAAAAKKAGQVYSEAWGVDVAQGGTVESVVHTERESDDDDDGVDEEED